MNDVPQVWPEPVLVAPPAPFDLNLPSSIEYEFIRNEDSSELVVVVSSALIVHKILPADERNVLYIADPHYLFFLQAFEPLSLSICAIVEHFGFTKTLFVGGSKGGYAALVLTALCARGYDSHQFRCVAIAPHTEMFPYNAIMERFPSYRNLMKTAETMPEIVPFLEKFGDAKAIEGVRNAQALIVYGELHEVDKYQAERLVAFNIQKMPLPVSFHGILGLLMVRDAPARVRAKVAERIFAVMMLDGDGRHSLPPTPADLALMLDEMIWLPSLKRLVAQMMAL